MSKGMKWVVGAFGVVFGFALLNAIGQQIANPGAAPLGAASGPSIDPAAVAAEAIAGVKMKPTWQAIRIEKAESSRYSFILLYKRQPAGYGEVEEDTKAIARSALKALMAHGANPRRDWIGVFVWGHQEGLRGETGTPLVRVFGSTSYDWNTDQLAFKPYRP